MKTYIISSILPRYTTISLTQIVATNLYLPPHTQASDNKPSQQPPYTSQRTAHPPQQKQPAASTPSNAPYTRSPSTPAHSQTVCTADRHIAPLPVAGSTERLQSNYCRAYLARRGDVSPDLDIRCLMVGCRGERLV